MATFVLEITASALLLPPQVLALALSSLASAYRFSYLEEDIRAELTGKILTPSVQPNCNRLNPFTKLLDTWS